MQFHYSVGVDYYLLGFHSLRIQFLKINSGKFSAHMSLNIAFFFKAVVFPPPLSLPYHSGVLFQDPGLCRGFPIYFTTINILVFIQIKIYPLLYLFFFRHFYVFYCNIYECIDFGQFVVLVNYCQRPCFFLFPTSFPSFAQIVITWMQSLLVSYASDILTFWLKTGFPRFMKILRVPRCGTDLLSRGLGSFQ